MGFNKFRLKLQTRKRNRSTIRKAKKRVKTKRRYKKSLVKTAKKRRTNRRSKKTTCASKPHRKIFIPPRIPITWNTPR